MYFVSQIGYVVLLYFIISVLSFSIRGHNQKEKNIIYMVGPGMIIMGPGMIIMRHAVGEHQASNIIAHP